MTFSLRRRKQPPGLEAHVHIDMPTDVDPAEFARQIHFLMGRHTPRLEPETPVPEPTLAATVHYVSYGTPGGEYPSVCRAAVVTAVKGPAGVVDLCVLNPEGMLFNRDVQHHDGAATPGDPDCPNAETHGNPFRYCACGWMEATRKGGTWHWSCGE